MLVYLLGELHRVLTMRDHDEQDRPEVLVLYALGAVILILLVTLVLFWWWL